MLAEWLEECGFKCRLDSAGIIYVWLDDWRLDGVQLDVFYPGESVSRANVGWEVRFLSAVAGSILTFCLSNPCFFEDLEAALRVEILNECL